MQIITRKQSSGASCTIRRFRSMLAVASSLIVDGEVSEFSTQGDDHDDEFLSIFQNDEFVARFLAKDNRVIDVAVDGTLTLQDSEGCYCSVAVQLPNNLANKKRYRLPLPVDALTNAR